jgi:uncharacterized membrane protein
MSGWENFWWIIPLIMIVLCFSMMRGGMGCMIGRHNSHSTNKQPRKIASDSAKEILDKRYALGEIDKEEYEEKKRAISKADE